MPAGRSSTSSRPRKRAVQRDVQQEDVDSRLSQEPELPALGVLCHQVPHRLRIGAPLPGHPVRPAARRWRGRCAGPGPRRTPSPCPRGSCPSRRHPPSRRCRRRPRSGCRRASGPSGPCWCRPTPSHRTRHRRPRAENGSSTGLVNAWPISALPTARPLTRDERAVRLPREERAARWPLPTPG